MIKNLSGKDIQEIKELLKQRNNSCFISKTKGYLITYSDEEYDFENIDSMTLVSCEKRFANIEEMVNSLKELNDFDKVIVFINLENELNNFKYFEIKSDEDIKRGFAYIAELSDKVDSIISSDKEFLTIDFDKVQSSLLLIKYKKGVKGI